LAVESASAVRATAALITSLLVIAVAVAVGGGERLSGCLVVVLR